MKKIAIMRRNGFGDLLCAVPLMTHLKRLYPEAALTLFADVRHAELLPFLRCYDRAVVFPRRAKYFSVIGTGLWNRRERYDLAISAKPSPMKLANLFLGALAADRRVAVTDESWHSRLINDPRKRFEGRLHQALKCLQLIEPSFDAVPTDLYPRLQLPDEPSGLPPLPNKFLFVTSVTNNRPTSLLPFEKLANVINRLSEKRDIHVGISCQPNDIPKAATLSKMFHSESTIVPTKDLRSLLFLLAQTDLVLCGDGGLMHLAAAMNTPQVVLFGGTRPEEWAPLSDKATCLHHPSSVGEIDVDIITEALRAAW
jgi:ADP-heptose:LPS heptosyltransferase